MSQVHRLVSVLTVSAISLRCTPQEVCVPPPLTPEPDLTYLESPPVDPTVTVEAELFFTVDTLTDAKPISRRVYGANFRRSSWQERWNSAYFDHWTGMTLARLGGNRLTGFNWENGASYSGVDLPVPRNDDYLGSNVHPGDVVREHVQYAVCHGADTVLTVPTIGKVAADRNGPIDDPEGRFIPSTPWADGDPSLSPDTTDDKVDQQSFAYHVRHKWFPDAGTRHADVMFSLDNEPSLWPENHPLLRQDPVLYEEMLATSIEYATMLKSVDPTALVFGGVLYGWNAYTTFQNAPDHANRDFVDTFLQNVQTAAGDGPLPIDVLDVHWYPEVEIEGIRIIEDVTSPELSRARVQAPRSLWDPNFTEKSWISETLGFQPVKLITRLRSKIERFAPGMRLALSEYSYGGEGSIDGGLAQADALGIFGRENVFAASWWPISSEPDYALGAFQLFKNVDGLGTGFGDVSVMANSSDVPRATVYASVDSQRPDRVVAVVVHKGLEAATASLTVRHTQQLSAARSWVIARGVPNPLDYPVAEALGGNAFKLTLPPRSAALIELLTYDLAAQLAPQGSSSEPAEMPPSLVIDPADLEH